MTGTYCTLFLGQGAVNSLPDPHFQSHWAAMHVALSPSQIQALSLSPAHRTYLPWKPSGVWFLAILVAQYSPLCVLHFNLTGTPIALRCLCSVRGVAMQSNHLQFLSTSLFLLNPFFLLRNPFHLWTHPFFKGNLSSNSFVNPYSKITARWSASFNSSNMSCYCILISKYLWAKYNAPSQ